MCKALGDEISLAIIKSTIEKSTPAIEIAKAHHVPLSSVYKKIRRLRELGVINIDKINVDDRSGKKITCYRSRVKAIQFSLAASETTVRIEGNPHSKEITSADNALD
jgi:hypothetical protein